MTPRTPDDLPPASTPARVTDVASAVGRRTPEADFAAFFEHSHLGIALVTADSFGVRYENDTMRRALDSCSVLPRRPGARVGETLHLDVAHGLQTVLAEARIAGVSASAVVPIPWPGVGRFDAWLCHAWPISLPRDAKEAERHPAVPRDDAPEGSAEAVDMLVLVVDASMSAAVERAQHRDVTERVLLGALREERRADEADRARRVAVDANAERGRMLAATSHELRTPLQAIGGYAELLSIGAAGEVNEAQRGILGNIVRAMHHLLQLSNALLEQARLEEGRVPYRMSNVNAVAMLREAMTLVGVQAKAKGVELSMAPCDDAVHVHADRGKLGQVVINLLANAIKFTGSGGSIRVSCARVDSDRHILPRVEICVRDTGRGIEPEHLERIFAPYVQLKPDASADSGVGLGLAISRTLARGMGGELSVTSEPGIGSTFTLSLPEATPDAAASDPRRAG